VFVSIHARVKGATKPSARIINHKRDLFTIVERILPVNTAVLNPSIQAKPDSSRLAPTIGSFDHRLYYYRRGMTASPKAR
jgi:hypothetical protein